MNGLFLMIDTTLCFFVALIIESESYSIVGIATFDPLAALEPDSINTSFSNGMHSDTVAFLKYTFLFLFSLKFVCKLRWPFI